MIGQNFVESSVFSLSKTPEGIVDSFLAHMNSFNTETMLRFYEEDAIFINDNGEPRRGNWRLRKNWTASLNSVCQSKLQQKMSM
ncbi:hypothetical protein IX39_12465 [Chryseobacterium formosense]|uniref:SnoaL-like domain-containing protein n=1 Tax=Chryseobacterium formosense TaxID=236814 RepID=A0A085ZAB4_9FLAO|nr:hypothetical protein IX39_12465 [Chryseobacterium formosense]SFT46475.1 hypothetical protein SAMN05421857_1179 [Chryseobacterium formosense]